MLKVRAPGRDEDEEPPAEWVELCAGSGIEPRMEKTADDYRDFARRCRALARVADSADMRETLRDIAMDCEQKADALEGATTVPKAPGTD